MSAEVPKEAGTTAPIIPQKPGGGFRKFLKRLLEPVAMQPTSRITQPPPGLENFADTIQSVIDGRFAAERQKNLDIEAAKAAQRAAEAEEKIKAARNQEKLERQEIDRQYREEQEQIEKEVLAILEPFRVVDRLQYIKDAVWGGKGEIRPHNGLELVYSYPSFEVFGQPGYEGHFSIEGRSYPSSPPTRKYEQVTGSTSLRVRVLYTRQDSGEFRKELSISSVVDSFPIEKAGPVEFFSVRIPLGAEESEALLESALKQEAVTRVDRGYLPLQLKETARKELVRAKNSGFWMRWGAVDDTSRRNQQQYEWNWQHDHPASN